MTMIRWQLFGALIVSFSFIQTFCSSDFTCLTATPGNGSVLKAASCSSPQDPNNTQYCLIFASIIFKCDDSNICDNHNSSAIAESHEDVKYNGTIGKLICCSTANCNRKELLATFADSTTTAVSPTPTEASALSCNVEDDAHHQLCQSAMCINSTVVESQIGVYTYQYSCDNQNLCKTNNIMDGNCAKVTDATNTVRNICCCASNNCNMPATSLGGTSTGTPLSSMPANPSDDSATHWKFTGGIIAAVALGILVFIIVAIVIKRYKQRQAEQRSYYYSELTQELTEDRENADDALLVA